jgi:lysophospholipase L1-like esterase
MHKPKEDRMKAKKRRPFYSILLFLVFLLMAGNLYSQEEIWVGSWSCATYAAGAANTPPSPYLANNTLRQIVRVSIGGDSLRLKISNKTCSTPLSLNSVNIAVSTGGSRVDASTITPLLFKGNRSVKLEAFSVVWSEPCAFELTPGMRVAITIHYGQASSSADITGHAGSRTDSYLLSGDQSASADFAASVITPHWFHINTIDVLAPDTAGCIGVLGNSISDGYGLSGGLQNRWTDVFSQQLLDNPRTEKMAVLNLGIGATTLTGSGLSRYKEDLLSQSALRRIIIFYGVNDIAAGVAASAIIDAYKTIIADAHAMNVKVYGATITPFKGHSYYTEARDSVRNTVNQWIRADGNFDACIDFDKAIRDPNEPAQLLAKYSNDWLHPNVAGYELLGKSVLPEIYSNFP